MDNIENEEIDSRSELADLMAEAKELDGGAAFEPTESEGEAPGLSQEAAAQEAEAQKAQELAEAPSTYEMILPIVSMVCGIAAPNWGISKPEIEALTGSYADLLDKYAPNGLSGKYAAEYTALIVTAGVVVPRLGKPPRLPSPKEKRVDKKQEVSPKVVDSGHGPQTPQSQIDALEAQGG